MDSILTQHSPLGGGVGQWQLPCLELMLLGTDNDLDISIASTSLLLSQVMPLYQGKAETIKVLPGILPECPRIGNTY